MDITAFFDSISEIAVQHTFRRIGYQPLMAFELARLCTRTVDSTWRNHDRWKVKSPNRFKKISSYQNDRIGFLPQGAPSSPMLANLVMHDFDDAMESLAKRHKFSYSRYADDLSFSTRRGIQRSDCINLVHDAYTEITKYGLTPNLTKTKIAPPGSRKLLLGLLIDRPDPRLTKEFRKNLRMHLYYLQTKGPIEHAKHRDFDTVYGLRNYLFGLAYFARQIDSAYGSEFLDELKKIDWPV